MKLNRKWIMVIALVMSLTMATAGTMAYLTDRDTEVNTFTMGNVDIEVEEEYEQDSELYPGVEVEKQAGIKNVHKTSDAWVWMTVSVPTELKDYIELSWLSDTVKSEAENNVVTDGVHDGYTSYVVKYSKELAPGDSTPKYLQGVTLSELVDYQDGSYGYVANGKFNKLNGLDDLKIIVDGFAMQTEGFDTVGEAYNAYVDQWDKLGNGGESGAEGGKEPEAANGDDDNVTYQIPTDVVRVTNSDELKIALNNKSATILLEDGEYDWNGTGHNGTAQTVNIYGESKDVILYHTNEGEGGTDYDFDGYNVNFYGLTISGEKQGKNYPGWARMSATYNDCVIKQTYGLYAGTHTFNYCTLDVTGDQYNIWTWGAENATFNNCTINSNGKAILLYGTASTKLSMTNCVFNDIDNGSVTSKKAAIEVGSGYGTTKEINVTNVDVNGYEINDEGLNTSSTLWGNKNSMTQDELNVVVDGVDVY